MNHDMNDHLDSLISPEALAVLGDGKIAYVKSIRPGNRARAAAVRPVRR
jgi:hypothetical protein